MRLVGFGLVIGGAALMLYGFGLSLGDFISYANTAIGVTPAATEGGGASAAAPVTPTPPVPTQHRGGGTIVG